MKRIALLFALVILFSGCAPPKKKVLIIGDSISIGYFPFVKEQLAACADVVHNKGNAQHTRTGLKNIDEWIGDEKWDVIQFNWGLWDLCYRLPNVKGEASRDKVNGKLTTGLDEYRSNLEALVKVLKKTNAKLVYVTTTYVPENEPGRFVEDAGKYNAVAKEVMKAHGVQVNDIYSASKKIHKKFAVAPNDVHYTKEGYQELAKLIQKPLLKELK